jgi:hypothetical protein
MVCEEEWNPERKERVLNFMNYIDPFRTIQIPNTPIHGMCAIVMAIIIAILPVLFVAVVPRCGNQFIDSNDPTCMCKNPITISPLFVNGDNYVYLKSGNRTSLSPLTTVLHGWELYQPPGGTTFEYYRLEPECDSCMPVGFGAGMYETYDPTGTNVQFFSPEVGDLSECLPSATIQQIDSTTIDYVIQLYERAIFCSSFYVVVWSAPYCSTVAECVLITPPSYPGYYDVTFSLPKEFLTHSLDLLCEPRMCEVCQPWKSYVFAVTSFVFVYGLVVVNMCNFCIRLRY